MNPTLFSAVLLLALFSVAYSQPFVKGGLLLLGAAKLGFIKGVLLANKINKKDKKYYHGRRQFPHKGENLDLILNPKSSHY